MMLRCAVPLALTALALSSCGGDSQSSASSASGSPANPVVAEEQPGSRDRMRSNEASSPVAKPDYAKLVKRQSSRPKSRFSPCNLVTRSEARSILGATVETPLEAPQGPTCIYRSREDDQFITIAVQPFRIGTLKRQMRGPTRIDVANRIGYCGRLGQEMLYVGLPHQRVLSVTAPCRLAREFAANAVRRLPG